MSTRYTARPVVMIRGVPNDFGCAAARGEVLLDLVNRIKPGDGDGATIVPISHHFLEYGAA